MKTPRALWVPFALGRSFGAAGDPQFQRAVLTAAFSLLTASEHTIENYPIEAPPEAGPEQWACPVSYQIPEDESLSGRLMAEVAGLQSWADETRASRGRTLFGVSGAKADQVNEVAAVLGHLAESGSGLDLPASTVDWQFPMPLLIRHLADDLRTYYHEAIAAQPGPGAPNHEALNQWIFGGSALGLVLRAIDVRLSEETDNPKAALVRGLLVPHGFRERA